jgi:hypothetical protein
VAPGDNSRGSALASGSLGMDRAAAAWFSSSDPLPDRTNSSRTIRCRALVVPPVTREATISRGARGLVLAGATFLVAATLAAALEEPRSTVVAFALYGFVLHTLFGKAYGLLPAYFDRDLAVSRAPQVQVPLSAVGAALLAVRPGSELAATLPVDPATATEAGAVLWAGGAAIFLATVALTIRDNPTGAETGTSTHKAERARLDRVANAAMPIALGYLALASYELLAAALRRGELLGTTVDLPSALDAPLAAAFSVSHLLAVGTAALLVFAVGARLLPRLLRADAPDALVGVVLAAGAVGPALLVGWFAGGVGGAPEEGLLHGAIMLLGVATVGHAVVVGLLCARAPSLRVGAYGVLGGAIAGVLTVGAGALIGLGERAELIAVHPRLGIVGFLGLTILGVIYHFYPPAVAGDRGDSVAAASLLLVGGGIALEFLGVLAGEGRPGDLAKMAIDGGRWLAALGALAYAGLLAAIVYERRK